MTLMTIMTQDSDSFSVEEITRGKGKELETSVIIVICVTPQFCPCVPASAALLRDYWASPTPLQRLPVVSFCPPMYMVERA